MESRGCKPPLAQCPHSPWQIPGHHQNEAPWEQGFLFLFLPEEPLAFRRETNVLHQPLTFCATWTSPQSRGYWYKWISSGIIYKVRMSEICFTLEAQGQDETQSAVSTPACSEYSQPGGPTWQGWPSPPGPRKCLNQRLSPSAIKQNYLQGWRDAWKTHVPRALLQRFRFLCAGTGLANCCEAKRHGWFWGL